MELTLLQQIIFPVAVILATQLVKRVSVFPINKGQKNRLRAVAGLLSFVSAASMAYANGGLETFITPDMINVGVGAAITFVLSQLGYKGIKTQVNL